jgi:hypothetical protein
MPKFKIHADYIIEVEVEVEAPNYRDAYNKVREMDLEEFEGAGNGARVRIHHIEDVE